MTVRRLAPLILALCGSGCRGSSTDLRIAGTIEIREIQIAPLASGRLVRLLKDEGDTVRAGDTVAILDQPGLSALIAQRRAQAAGVATRTAEVGAAVADSARAANDLGRARALRDQGIVSPQQFDALATSAAAAASRLAAVRAAPSDAAAARAGVDAVLAIRDELTLIAPADGIILTRYAENGEAVAAGSPVLSLGVVRRPWVQAYVAEPYLARINVGTRVRIHADGYPDSAFTGTIVEIAPRAEFTPRAALTERERADLVFGIRVSVSDSAGRLKAGMPVTLAIPLAP
jgi:HlyD family secretion protein